MLSLHLSDERYYYPLRSFMFPVYPSIIQGILRLRGRPSVAYDQQGLVFAVAMEGGAIKLFDSRSYDKVPNEHNTGRILYLWKGCKYLSQEYKSNFRVHLILSWLAEIQLKFLTSNLAMTASLCFWQPLTTISMFWMHMEGTRSVKLSWLLLPQILFLVVRSFCSYHLISLHPIVDILLIPQCNLQKCGFSLEPSPNVTNEAAFTPDGQYVISGRTTSRYIC